MLRRIAQERLGLDGRFPSGQRDAADRAEAVLLAARPGALGGGAQADRPAVLDRHGGALEPRRDAHPARRRGDARVRAPQRRLCVELGNLPAVDGRHLAGADHRRDPVPAQPDPPDPAARRRGRELRQGPRGRRLPPARRPGGAARGFRLHRDEIAGRAHHRAAHHHARRRVARSAHRADALQARARPDRRRPRGRGDEEGHRRDEPHARGLSRLRARRRRRAVRADRHGGVPRGAAGRRRAPRPQGDGELPRLSRSSPCGPTRSSAASPTSSPTPRDLPPPIEITGQRDHRYLTITVDDDGPGIPAHLREDVFKPFLRLDDAAQPGRRRQRARARHRARHRPLPWRRHHCSATARWAACARRCGCRCRA